MKKIVLLSCFILTVLSSWASGAYRFPMEITQSDGTRLTVIGHGNSDFNWITTSDGVLIIRQGKDFYIAEIDEMGNVKPTQQLAHNKDNRDMTERALVAKQDKEKFLQVANNNLQNFAKKAAINQNGTYTPHMGNVKSIVILVEFTDTAFTLPNPKKSFEYYLNGEHYGDKELVNGENELFGSVKQYFTDCSFGKFSPTFDVYGPVKLNRKHSYYGGTGKGSLLAQDACLAADSIVDFSKPEYDSDGDGIVDCVCIVFAGYSSSFSVNPKNWIWPSSNGSNIGTYDGVKVYRSMDCNELNAYPGAFPSEPYIRINGIGVFCHEFSHCLGLPDLYPTNRIIIDNQEMEYWDLMDNGEYLNNGYTPPAYTAWERETMGWMTIDTLETDQKNISILPIDDEGGKAYRFMNPNDINNREYFLLENIQNKGWNILQKGHGLLVYHLNYKSDIVNVNDHPNNEAGMPRVAVVPADGWLMSSYKVGQYINPETGKEYTTTEYNNNIAGDPFPGTHNVTELKYDMNLPNYKWQIGKYAGKAWEEIDTYRNGYYYKKEKDSVWIINETKYNGSYVTSKSSRCYRIVNVKQGDRFRLTGAASGSTFPFYILTGKDNVIKAYKMGNQRNTPVVLEITSTMLEEKESGILYVNLNDVKDGDMVEKEVDVEDPEVRQAILNIREDVTKGTVTFDFVTDIANAISNTIIDVNIDNDAIYTIDGRKINSDYSQLKKGIYIKNNKKFIVR